MEKYSQLFNRNSKGKEWFVLQDQKLELKLGPPGEDHYSPHSFGYGINNSVYGAQSAFQDTLMSKGLASIAENSSKLRCSRVAEACCSPADDASVTAINTSVANCSSKRFEVSPVVGWPPVRSFLKNIANGSLSNNKPASGSPIQTLKKGGGGKPESLTNDLFVKINMEGVPIGRKVNLSAHNSYEELSFAIDELFKGLLGAQRVALEAGNENMTEETLPVTSSAPSDEYTLVYEDNEGDRVLVGDVPWHMFISTVKKLLVLKSSEL